MATQATTPPTEPPAADTAPEQQQPEQQEKRDLAPGGYPCNACGITFRTPEELEAHTQKNAGKEGSEHIQ